MQKPNDYFAAEQLAILDVVDPVEAAFTAQVLSREVGFDFSSYADVVPRALDELRETEEAYMAAQDGSEVEVNHFGDEIADIMFSHINLARHAGLRDLAAIADLSTGANVQQPRDVHAILSGIRTRIEGVSPLQSEANLQTVVADLYETGMRDAIELAISHGFDPQTLLRENVRKYLVRCKGIEDLAAADGKTWSDLAEQGLIITYWKQVKRTEAA